MRSCHFQFLLSLHVDGKAIPEANGLVGRQADHRIAFGTHDQRKNARRMTCTTERMRSSCSPRSPTVQRVTFVHRRILPDVNVIVRMALTGDDLFVVGGPKYRRDLNESNVVKDNRTRPVDSLESQF